LGRLRNGEMVDKKGFDPHLVLDSSRRRWRGALRVGRGREARAISDFVDRYKIADASQGKWARFVGWAEEYEGKLFVGTTATFFDNARD
jgi:hypothetical protein